jgi:hypothetical protein
MAKYRLESVPVSGSQPMRFHWFVVRVGKLGEHNTLADCGVGRIAGRFALKIVTGLNRGLRLATCRNALRKIAREATTATDTDGLSPDELYAIIVAVRDAARAALAKTKGAKRA